MTEPSAPNTLDLWRRLANDPSGEAFRSTLKQLDDMRLKLEAGLRQPLSRQDYQSREAALKAVRAGAETLLAAHRIVSSQKPDTQVRPAS